MYLFEVTVRDMSIDLGGPDALMTQHFLDGANVGTTYQQVRGKGMPQGVRSGLDWQARPFCILGNNSLDGPCR